MIVTKYLLVFYLVLLSSDLSFTQMMCCCVNLKVYDICGCNRKKGFVLLIYFVYLLNITLK